MATVPLDPSLPSSARADALAAQWAALHEAAGLVAGLAGQAAASAALAGEPCPDSLLRARGWRLALAERGLADTAAILEGGIRALLVARSGGAAVHGAADALWQEFVAARQAMVDLARPI